MAFSVRFWGVRGSIACSGPRTARYGGNTSSLEVRCGDRVLLFDAGTGMRYLGNAMDSAGPIEAIEADVTLSLTFAGTLMDLGGGMTTRAPGTVVTGTATSGDGVYEVNLVLP